MYDNESSGRQSSPVIEREMPVVTLISSIMELEQSFLISITWVHLSEILPTYETHHGFIEQ